MVTEITIAIATAAAALLTSFATIIHNQILKKKEMVHKVVLENRVRYLMEIREGFSNFIGLCNIRTIRLAKDDPVVMEKYSGMLFLGYGKIKTHLKPFYDIDNEVLTSLDRLYDCVLSILDGDEGAAESIDELRETFSDLYLKYDWAYWKYIQKQRSGKYIDSDGAFDDTYREFIKSLEKTSNKLRYPILIPCGYSARI